MKSTPHHLMNALSPFLLPLVITLMFGATVKGQFFPLPGTFFFGRPQDQVFDISPDGKIAITLRNDPAGHPALLTTFDPILGTQFDSKTFGFGPVEVRMVQVGSSLRAVVLTHEGGPRRIYLFDVSSEGKLTQLASTQLTTSTTTAGSNLVLSGSGAVGFVIVSGASNFNGDIVSFSLNDGAIIKRLAVSDVPASGGVPPTIALNDGPGRRLLAFRKGNDLKVFNVLDPAQPVETASVPLASNGEFSGSSNDSLTFSTDGRFVFLANQFFNFAAISVDSAQIVGTIPGNFRFTRVESVEHSQGRLLAVLSESAASGGTHALLIVDATNPSQLTVLKNVTPAFGSFFAFSRDGSRLYMAEPTRLVAFELPDFTTAWEQSVPGFIESAHQLRVYGPNDEVLGAWQVNLGNFTSLFGAFPASSPDVSLSDSLTINETAGAASFTVSLTSPTSHRVTVSYSTADGTALDFLDYSKTSGSVIIEPGKTSGLISIPIVNDDRDEPDQSFTLSITSNLGIVTRAQSTVTILDEDPPPSASVADVSVVEGNLGNKNLTFRVTLSPLSEKTVTISYVTATGSATDSDFISGSGTLTFVPSQTANNVVVQIVGDRLSEGDEMFLFSLSNPNNVTIVDSQATGTIVDDDAVILAVESPSQRAIALDAVTLVREPFALTNPHYFGADKRTRVVIFTLNLILTPGVVVTAEAEDSQQVVHQLPVEFVGNVPGFTAVVPQEPFLTQIVLKLPEGIVSAGDLQVSITTRGKTSNKVLIGVKP